MDTRTDQHASQIKVYLQADGSVHKEIGPVTTESLVFEGGGVRGIGYIGATRALFECGIMPAIKRVAGTSAGAVTASIVALGYQQDGIERILKNNNIEELMESKRLFTPAKISKLLKHGFFNEGDKLLAAGRLIGKTRFSELIASYRSLHANNQHALAELDALKINVDRITFQDYRHLARLLPGAGIKDLYIIAAKLTKNSNASCEIKIFSAEQTPNVEVALAVRASLSIPKLFKPVEIDGERYVDGGVISNFPIHIFDDERYAPENVYMYQGNNGQNFSSLGLKIDTEDEVRDLKYAPAKKRTIDRKIKDKMIDQIAGMPIYHSYKMNHRSVREHYSHRSPQLSDEGIKSTQLTITDEEAEQLIQRGYDDMKLWIDNYHNGAIESRRFSSFQVMCENMNLDELEKFNHEMVTRPHNIIFSASECGMTVADEIIEQFQKILKVILKERAAAQLVIRQKLPLIDELLAKYNTNLISIYSRLEHKHEVGDLGMWLMAADAAIQIIISSDTINSIKKDDVMQITDFVNEIKVCGDLARPREVGFLRASRKMDRFSMPASSGLKEHNRP